MGTPGYTDCARFIPYRCRNAERGHLCRKGLTSKEMRGRQICKLKRQTDVSSVYLAFIYSRSGLYYSSREESVFTVIFANGAVQVCYLYVEVSEIVYFTCMSLPLVFQQHSA